MKDTEKYAEVMKELGELLKSKNETIELQKWQIANLTAKVEELEEKCKLITPGNNIEYR